MANSIRVLMQYRPGYPQTSTAIQEEIWIDISKRVDYQSLQWEQQATEQNTVLRFDIFTMLSLSTTRYDDYPSWVTSGSALDANTGTSLGMVDPVNDPSFFIDVANRTEVKVQEWEFVGGNYQIVKTLWGGVVSSVDTERNGDSFIVQRVECSDYTALLDELIIRDYNAPTVSEELAERATISGLTTEVIAGGATLTAGPYTFRVVAYDASDEIVDIFTHVSQNLTATDIDPPGISDTPLRTIKLDWTSVAGATYYKVFAKSGIGVKDMYYKATVTSPTVTYNLSTAPAVSGDLSPEGKVQKGSIDIDIVRGSTDPANANYKGIFNAIDPDLDPGIDNQTAYVETAKKLNDGTPDPDKSYRFSPTLETGVVLTSPFGGKTIKQALNIITEKTGAVFWVDANKDLHYTNKQARELVENPRFESSPAATGFSVAAGHAITQDRGPFGYGRALVASAGATTAESKTDPIPVTANNYYFARVRGWAKTNFASDWDAELVFYSDTAGTIQVGNVHKLHRNIAFDSTDDGRWCKTWVLAQAHNTAVTARIVAKKKSNGSDEVAWTDFSLVEVTGSIGFSDTPSEVAYALPMKSFETPKAPRSASKVANRLLVYGVYKNLKNPSELESIETDISLTLKKVAAGSLAAAKYYVRVVATVGGEDVICTYATETITDQDVTDGNRELYASWAAVTGATQYKIYVGTKRFAMRLKATQAGTTLSIQTPAAGGAAVAPEPEVYYYKVFDFAPGIWESGGKILEAAINDSLVDNDEKAQTRALSFWEEKGIAERTWEFDTFEETVPMVGEVIPFVWAADDTAEPLMVKGVKARLLGERVYYTVIVGDDPLLTKRGVTQIFADMQAATARLNDTIAPEPPQSLVVSAPSAALIQTPDGVTRASVTAQWTPSPEDDFAHYSVEYGYDPNFTEVQRANVSQTSDSQSSSTGVKANVVHTFQAEPGKTLYYRVAAVDQTNNRSQWSSDEIVTPQDTTPCDPPTALTVEPGLRSNTLTWSFDFYDPTTPLVNTENTDFARFRVYRRVHNTGSYVAVAETSATQYVDTDFADYTSGYNYAVTSLDRTGNESGTPGTGGATGVAYNTTNSVPSKINGGVDITTASITGAEIANATITDANIGSINADKITAGTLNVSTGMTIVSDGTAASPQFEVGPNGVIIRDDGGNVVLEVNGSTAEFNADFIDVSGITADELTVGSGENVVRVGTNASPAFSGIWAGQSNPSEAPFTVNTDGEVSAKNITVFGGRVLIGELGPAIDEISLAATTGIVTVTTATAYNADKYTVGARILVDTAGTYGSAPWANGYFVIASTPTSTTFTYESGDLVSGPLSDASATGYVYLGSQMAVGGDGGSTAAWMTVEGNKFALKNPADPNENVIEATAAAVTINADFINAGAINIGSLDSNALTATNFSVTNAGVVTAGSGNNVAIISPTDAIYRLWLGHSTGSSAPFSVTSTGSIYATSGTVGGWTLSSTSLTGGDTTINSAGDITLGTGSNIARLSSSDAAYRLWLGATSASSAPFRVTSTGELTATSATISGSVTATSGAIGGWTLSSTSLTGGDTIINSSGDITVGTGSNVARLSSSDPAYRLWLGGTTASTAPFRVTTSGALTATGADITGTITATSGSFTGDVTTSNITATGGTIGGWSLTSTSLTNYGGSSGQYAGILDTASTGLAFFAGATTSTGTSSAFSVTNDGAIAATNVNITGGPSGGNVMNVGGGRFIVDSIGNATANSIVLGSTSSSVSLAEKTSTTATITTSTTHPFVTGDRIVVALTSGPTNFGELNGVWTVTATTTTTITFTTTGTSTVTSGAAVGVVSYGAGNDATGKVALVPLSTQGAASFTVQVDALGNLYNEVDLNSTTSGSSTVDATVTTDGAHGFVAGQFVSFHSTGNSGWNAITASLPVQIKTVPTTNTFTIRPASSLTALAANNAGKVRAYKRLNIVAPGGAFVYQSGTTPGVLGSGSLVLGSTLADLGEGALATVADGEIGFLTPATPRYLGGASLFSRTGESDVATAGDFILGTGDTSTQGAIIFKGGSGGSIRAFSASAGNDSIAIKTTDGSAYTALVADTFFPGGQGSFRLDHDGNFDLNDSLDVGGNVTATGSVTGSTIYSTSAGIAFAGSIGADIVLTGADTLVPISGNGELNAIPNTTTATTNSARWVLVGTNTYGLRRDSSTRRVKTNIVQADEGVLAAAKRLRAVHFEPLEKDEDGNLRGTGQLTLGLIAEEILEAGLGCAVTYDAEGLPDGYDERVLMAAMLHHINDLEARLAALENA